MSYGEIAAMASIISVLVGAGVSYGITKGTINGLRARVQSLEANRYMTREEYEARHSELVGLFKELIKR